MRTEQPPISVIMYAVRELNLYDSMPPSARARVVKTRKHFIETMVLPSLRKELAQLSIWKKLLIFPDISLKQRIEREEYLLEIIEREECE